MNILIAVTGSISAYKSYDIIRNLINNGATVRVLCSNGALEFIRPQTFRYLGAKKVYLPTNDFLKDDEINSSSEEIQHIELSRWADQLLIAPASANMISQLSQGCTSNLISSVFLAWDNKKPIHIFPAMNSKMYHHPFTQENIKKLETLDNILVHKPAKGLLACGDFGDGKLPSVELITDVILSSSLNFFETNNTTKNILISTGATIAPIDSVRYLTNSSSGITGFYIAQEALSQGYNVCVIAGKNASSRLDHLLCFKRYRLVRATTNNDFEIAIKNEMKNFHYYISAAAIGDIEFTPSNTKIKKSEMPESIVLKRTPDILKELLAKRSPTQKIIGFAAESGLNEKLLREKWTRKPVDLLIGTEVNNGLTNKSIVEGFSNDNAKYSFFENNNVTFTGMLKKKNLAKSIMSRINKW